MRGSSRNEGLLHLQHLLCDLEVGGLGVFGRLDDEPDATRVRLDDAKAAVRCAIFGLELFERRGDEGLPELHLGLVGELAAGLSKLDRDFIDAKALRPGIARLSRHHLDEVKALELMLLR